MSPSGKLLALGGAPGLQLFHFNGASAPAPYKGNLFPSDDNPGSRGSETRSRLPRRQPNNLREAVGSMESLVPVCRRWPFGGTKCGLDPPRRWSFSNNERSTAKRGWPFKKK